MYCGVPIFRKHRKYLAVQGHDIFNLPSKDSEKSLERDRRDNRANDYANEVNADNR